MLPGKISLLLVLFLAPICSAYADLGSYFCMQATIVMKDGTKQKGYFQLATYDLAISKDDMGFFYSTSLSAYNGTMRLRSPADQVNPVDIVETDYHFHTAVQRLFPYDSIRLYRDIVTLRVPYHIDPDEALIPAFIGDPALLYFPDIETLVIHRVYLCNPGVGVNTKCERKDADWLNDEVISKEHLEGNDICSYTAYFYGTKSEQVSLLMQDLKILYKEEYPGLDVEQNRTMDEVRNLQHRIAEKVDALKKERVIVVSRCGC